MSEEGREAATERHLRCLSAFVLRARRATEHSLAQDREQLARLYKGELNFSVNAATGTGELVVSLPPEEQLESAAARLRPLVLQGDDPFWGNAIKALNHFAKPAADPELLNAIGWLKEQWKQFDSHSRAVAAYAVSITAANGESAPMTPDNVLAWAYLYGDVIHHDAERLTETELFGVRERYRSAAWLVARMLVATGRTLELVTNMKTAGLLPLDDDLFTRPVVVTDPVIRLPATAFFAEAHTPAPGEGETPDGPWTKLTPETLQQLRQEREDG